MVGRVHRFSDKFIETLYNSLTGSKGQFMKHN